MKARPETKTLLLTLTNRRGRVIFQGYADFEAPVTYSYRADGAGGASLTYETMIARAVEHTCYHPSAKPTGEIDIVLDYKTALDKRF